MFKLFENSDVADKRVLLRVDFNVPIQDGKIVDDYRILKSLKTLDALRDAGAKTVLISHIESGEKTLRPVSVYLQNKGYDVLFTESEIGQDLLTESLRIGSGAFLLLENIRRFEGEKQNDEGFTKSLGMLGDVYIDDAFAVMHRPHASVVGLPAIMPSYFGYLVHGELENLQKVLHPEKPFLFVLGGAKTETKLPLLQKFLGLADTVVLGGVIANDCIKAKGGEIGLSKVSEVGGLMSVFGNPKIILPGKVITKDGTRKSVPEVLPQDSIVDISPDFIDELKAVIGNAKTIVWNGPLGLFENGFQEGTIALAKAISESSAFSVIGGGDTNAVINDLGIEKFDFVSTGGGAMLEYLSFETLPGLEILK